MIEFYVSDKHEVKCNACFIGRTGENEAEEIRVIVPDCVCDKWLYLDFEKPDGTKFKTPRIDIVDGIGSYMLGGSLVDTAGMLKVEAVLQDENGVVWKSEKKEYYVSKSIDATTEVEKTNPDFITEAQKILDEIEAVTNEKDPTVPQHVKNITEEDIEKWNNGTGGKVDDVLVDGKSVVVNKIANIDLKQTVINILLEYGLINLWNLTQEQIKALNEMQCSIDENGSLNITYDDTVLDLKFQIEDKNLIINNNINVTFSINDNGDMEVYYE